MLGIRRIGDLATAVHATPSELYRVSRDIADYVQVYELHDPEKPEKIRTVVCPTGALRRIQTNLLRSVFRKALRHSHHSYGGVPGRNAKQNASLHIPSRFIYVTDLSDFFPSITAGRVKNVFVEKQHCSDEVASLLTRLCTYDGHLAQGLITSPILADQAVRRADARIAGFCRDHGLSYSRFVDDITVSGPFGLDHEASSVVALIRKIITECGFKIALRKERSGRVGNEDIAITGLRIVNGHLDVASAYLQTLLEHLERHRRYAAGEDLNGPFYTSAQLKGRIDYVCSINGSRSRQLRPLFASIDWSSVLGRALAENRVASRKRLLRHRAPAANTALIFSDKTSTA